MRLLYLPVELNSQQCFSVRIRLMKSKLPHVAWLKETTEPLKTSTGKKVAVYEFQVDSSDTATLSAWAKHFREHYCLDAQIDRLRKGPGKTRSEYLVDLVFPDKTEDFGPATRSGDFAEILVADLIEELFGYWVPRTRYGDKKVRNESPKGTDVVGLKLLSGDPEKPSPKDVVITFESKAQLKSKKATNRLQDAVDDSVKDMFRLAESLNAINHRLIDLNRDDEASYVQRFQDALGRPFIRKSGAAAVYCSSLYQPALMSNTDCSKHENKSQLMLVVVHADQMMRLVHALYARAASEA